jgi:hypothetical protein
MADNIVQGLFGMTPESYQLQQDQAAQAQALQYAQMNPYQRAAYGMYLGGNRLGGAIGGALGAQDPMLQRITRTQSLLQGIDPSDEVSLAQGIKAASEFNPQLAISLSGELQKLQKSKAESYKAYKEAQSNEQRNAGALADASGATRGTPEWTTMYKKELERLTAKAPNESLLKAQAIVDARAAVRKYPEGSPERAQAEDLLRALSMDKSQVVEIGVKGNPEMVQKATIDPFNPTADPVPIGAPYSRFTAKTAVNVTQKGQEEFTKRLGGKDADRVDASISAREAANAQLDIADRIEAMNPTAMSGQFANTRAGAVNFLDSLGLTSPKDKQMLMSSEVLTADTSRLVLATLNNKLGGGISNSDAKRVEQIFPQLENSPAARQELVNIIRRSANKVIKESYRLENYARKNEGLGGYEPEIKLPGASPRNPYSGLSDAELEARIRAAQGNR